MRIATPVVNHNSLHVSVIGVAGFSDINIPRGAVARRSTCGGIFNLFTELSLSVKKF